MQPTDSESSSTTSIDYEALVFEDGELYKNLQKVWSLYMNGSEFVGSVQEEHSKNEDDIELDVDYDALVELDQTTETKMKSTSSDNCLDANVPHNVTLRLALSTPNISTKD